MQRHHGKVPLLLILLAATGCATVPGASRPGGDATFPDPSRAQPALPRAAQAQIVLGQRIAELARSQLGAPYRYGGADPLGFDCSGLVRYVFGKEGVIVPRTAAAQQQAAFPVPLPDLRAGDLLFYRSGSAGVDHVAIYIGDGLMVHAPRSGRTVELGRVDDTWYARRFIAAGRLPGEP